MPELSIPYKTMQDQKRWFFKSIEDGPDDGVYPYRFVYWRMGDRARIDFAIDLLQEKLEQEQKIGW